MQINKFLSGVYFYMTLALAATGITAYLFGTTDLIHTMYEIVPTENGEGTEMSMTGLGWVVTLAPLVMIFGLGAILRRTNSTIMFLGLMLFSVLMGMSMSYIFIFYTGLSIFTTFLITAGLFSVLSIAGLVTNVDLTNLGTFLLFALIGLIIAMIANWFIQSPMMHYIISGIAILVFLGLTAYDTQKLKEIGRGLKYGNDESKKLAIWGALDLYLDFINLFIHLLQFLGVSSSSSND